MAVGFPEIGSIASASSAGTASPLVMPVYGGTGTLPNRFLFAALYYVGAGNSGLAPTYAGTSLSFIGRDQIGTLGSSAIMADFYGLLDPATGWGDLDWTYPTPTSRIMLAGTFTGVAQGAPPWGSLVMQNTPFGTTYPSTGAQWFAPASPYTWTTLDTPPDGAYWIASLHLDGGSVPSLSYSGPGAQIADLGVGSTLQAAWAGGQAAGAPVSVTWTPSSPERAGLTVYFLRPALRARAFAAIVG